MYLNHTLQGQQIQEPQPWATTFERSPNGERLAAQLFNAEVRSERNLLSCYVYDIESANLDNQHLLIPYESQLPIGQLYRDSIAKHFIGGYSELPLDESDLVSMPKLVPPPISMLTNQAKNGWLQNPSRVQRFADETIDGRPCYVVRSKWQGVTADIWIDQQTKLLSQISLPIEILAPEIKRSPEVKDVVLLARFHEAKLNQTIDSAAFKVGSHKNSIAVRKFVQLPETLPSELIGETASDFTLVDSMGNRKNRLHFDGKTTAFLWIAGPSSYSAIPKFNQLAESFSREEFHLALVYSDSELANPDAITPQAEPQLAQLFERSNVTPLYDPQLKTSVALGVKTIPSIVVIDGDSKIQFARTLEANWERDVQAAIKRVDKSEDLATEMKSDYVRYLDSYHQQLATVSATDLASRLSAGVAQVAATRQTSGVRLRPQRAWNNREFKMAGNVIPTLNSNRSASENGYLVFDGWRTIAELNSNGQTIRRSELKLPVSEAANLIRVGRKADGERCFAVFATLGEKVYLFDQNWRPMAMYPPDNGTGPSGGGIRDCRLTDLDGDGTSELVVAFEKHLGVHLVDPQTGRGEQVSKADARSLISLESEVVVAGEGKIGALKAGLTNVDETELDFQRVAASGNEQLCGLGVTATGNWNAVGFDTNLKRIWTLSVGSQFFETQIEPIAQTRIQFANGNSQALWAIADKDNVIHLVSGSGKWLGDFQSESQLHGMTLNSTNGSTFLTICNESGVESWNLNLESKSGVPAKPVSHQK